jgi:hypothetical protein
MTKKEIKRLVDNINRNFKPPFVPEGLVQATVNKDGKSFTLIIGPRDVDFDDECDVLGAGTCMF